MEQERRFSRKICSVLLPIFVVDGHVKTYTMIGDLALRRQHVACRVVCLWCKIRLDIRLRSLSHLIADIAMQSFSVLQPTVFSQLLQHLQVWTAPSSTASRLHPFHKPRGNLPIVRAVSPCRQVEFDVNIAVIRCDSHCSAGVLRLGVSSAQSGHRAL